MIENWQLTETFIWCTIALKWSLKKVNKSWYIALLIFVLSGSIKKLSSVDCVSIYLFTTFFSRFCPVEKAFLNKFMMMTAFAEWLVDRQNKSSRDHRQKFVHHQSLTRPKQDLNLNRTGAWALFNKAVQSRDNHWTYF